MTYSIYIIRKFIYLIIVIFIFLSCNENKEQKQPPLDSTQIQNKLDNQDSVISNDNTIDNKSEDIIALTNEPLAPEKLEKLLPKSFTGAKTLPANYGKFDDDGKVWTTASVDFSFSKPGGVQVQIFDYGSQKSIPEEEIIYFDRLPEETGYVTDRITIPNGKGYLKWDKEYRRGKLRLLYLNRFVIKIDGTNLPKDAPGLELFLNKINFNLIKK